MSERQSEDGGLITEPPRWFAEKISEKPIDRYVKVEDCKIHYLQWGDTRNPGLAMVAGAAAHAHWFDFLAPFFADRFNVVAIDLSGMGESGRRKIYDHDLFVEEMFGVMGDAGMLDHPIKPMAVGHSMGGMVTTQLGTIHGEHLTGVVICDVARALPEGAVLAKGQRMTPPPTTKKFYPSREAVLERFRLAPAQPFTNKYILDYIGPYSVHEEAEGWTWKFDPSVFASRRQPDEPHIFASVGDIKCRCALLFGANSAHANEASLALIREELGGNGPLTLLPEAQHHLLLDQPLAFVATVDAILTGWVTDSLKSV